MDNIEAVALLIRGVQFLKMKCGEAAAVCYIEQVERRLGVKPGSIQSDHLRDLVCLKRVKKSGGPSVIKSPKSNRKPKSKKKPNGSSKEKHGGKRKKQKL